MEKHIANWTYWLGVACLVIALVWRIASIWMGPQQALGIVPLSFYKGALLFFITAIATANYSLAMRQKS
jgi:hypothetical protein